MRVFVPRSGRRAPGGIRRVNIPIVRNATHHSDLTNTLTNRLIQKFNTSKVLIVTVSDVADAVLEADIKSVLIESAARTQGGQTSASRRVTVTVRAVLRRLSDNKVLWQSPGVVGLQTYVASADQSLVEANLLAAKAAAAEEIADKIHNGVFEGF